MKWIISFVVTLLLGFSWACAITIYVPGDYPTLQQAFSASSDGDSILIDPGEYEGLYVTSGPSDLTILGSGAFVANPTVIHRSPINPYGECIHIENASGWELAHFTLSQLGPSGGSTFDLHYSDNVWIHHLDFAEVAPSGGNGLVLKGTSNVTVERCLFRAGNYDVLTCWYVSNSNVTYRNITVSGNGNGIINRASVPNWDIRNCLIYDNGGDGFEIHYWLSSYNIQYNDSYGNNGSNYYGFTPDPTNLSLDPLVLGGTGWMAYLLQPNSPCIDAGDPNSPLDPDGTIADIGCFYFDQNFTPGELTLYLDPVNPPVILPPQGGSFDYTAAIACDSNYAIFDFWTELLLPDGQIMGPLYIRPDIFMAAGDSLSRQLQMYVSAWAMPGTYEFRGYVGDSPNEIWASDFFTFEKLPMEGPIPEGQTASVIINGWDLTEKIYVPVAGQTVGQTLKISGSPNPFNPVTNLTFSLPASGKTRLSIYDVGGRTLATLLDREMSAGDHAVSFDGSSLASGIYLSVLEWNGKRTVERLVLMK